jgi:two-component sensor histidine kinase
VTLALQVSGFQVLDVAEAEAALTAVALNPDITVVLTDIRMPGRSGIALAQQLLTMQLDQRAVEVVLMSGHAGFDEALSAMRAGAFDLLRKPLRVAEIAAATHRARARARARRSAALAAEQARLDREALMLAAPVGLGRIGCDLRLSSANPVLAGMLGIPDGSHIADFWGQAPGLRQVLEPSLELILTGEVGQPPTCLRFELPNRLGAGLAGQRVLDLRLYPVPDGEDPSRVGAVGLACLDVTAEAALLRELDHRVKNAFAVFQGLLHGAARHAVGRDVATVAAELTDRIMALSHAHDLVRPAVCGLPGIVAPQGTTMRTLAETVLAGFSGADEAASITFRGPEVAISPGAAPTLALLLHELATNALKHGALSAPVGRVDLAWATTDDVLTLDWREAGGPAVAGPPARAGFGMRLLSQFNPSGARLRTALDWSSSSGLQASISLPLASD